MILWIHHQLFISSVINNNIYIYCMLSRLNEGSHTQNELYYTFSLFMKGAFMLGLHNTKLTNDHCSHDGLGLHWKGFALARSWGIFVGNCSFFLRRAHWHDHNLSHRYPLCSCCAFLNSTRLEVTCIRGYRFWPWKVETLAETSTQQLRNGFVRLLWSSDISSESAWNGPSRCCHQEQGYIRLGGETSLLHE